jgi:heme exporter protein D
MDEYAPFVLSAYAITAASIAGLVLWVLVDRRQARKALERAERAAERSREASRAR